MSSFLTHAIVASLALPAIALAGPYSGPSDTINALDGAIASSSGVFVEWADDIDASGTSFAPNGSTAIDTSGGFNSLGDLSQADIDNGLMPGQITVTFPTGIADGPGADFAVFENGFVFPSDPFLFAELAFVEVSSDGLTFARFPAISTNTTFQGNFGQSFGGFDTTNIFNLAGKHADGFGTPFDLSDLASDPLVTGGQVDLDAISAVRLVDVVGDGTTLDSLGNPIIDAWLTTGTGGFDFRLGVGTGVGVINVVPEPATGGVFAMAAAVLLGRRRRAASRSSAGLALAGAAAAVGLASVPAAAQTTITFEPLAPVSPDYPSNTGFTAGGVEFTGAAFSGWVAADGTDTTTPGFLNQYSVFPGVGAGGSDIFAIAFGNGSFINLPAGKFPVSADLTATTYTALSILNGDSFAKQFGGPTGDDPDLFTVTLTGYDGPNGTGSVTGTPVEFTLADYTSADNSLDFVVDEWIQTDLTPLGEAASIGLTFFSTDVGTFGINTPTYVALDNLTLIPEPGLAGLLAGGVILLVRRQR